MYVNANIFITSKMDVTHTYLSVSCHTQELQLLFKHVNNPYGLRTRRRPEKRIL